MKKKSPLLSITILLSLLLTGCDENGGLIIPDYRDKWTGDYQCQYGCVHSYAEGMDTANFVYTDTRRVIVYKTGETNLSISGMVCSVDSTGHFSEGMKPFSYKEGYFRGDSLFFYTQDAGHPGFFFYRYKCAKIWPYRRKR